VTKPSHTAMGAAWTAALLAGTGRPTLAVLAGAVAGGAIAHVPDFDHRSRGLWHDWRDWLHCVEPWAALCWALAQLGSVGPWLALVVAGASGSHMLGDSFTTAGIPASIVVRSITGRTWGAKLFPSTVPTVTRRGYRESYPATVTAGLLTVAGIVLALALGGAL
jgi:membrane-bound metal-dependent hydrolase YbcI (DUF457 family)